MITAILVIMVAVLSLLALAQHIYIATRKDD
jgi:hypothetical protein